ncbi:segregation/condensation protein A [uncultured Sphaerochaeta sp.]|uniref:segregation and condensation protein A n=1 Tax=uncultured Sphaerochaeta sp. TaxID=886478 RepID=UPI002A0A1D9F|nr:segregation/condensation protein A [uncultured Sphaerochaeta sp.]
MQEQTVQEEQVPKGATFHTPTFDGPLDLLLFLIQKSEVNIYDIPISLITEQFLGYLKEEKVTELGDLTQFYKMAADLLYIKSRMLLPVELEFDEEYQDPRQELVDRLLEYQKFRKYTELLTGTNTSAELFITRKSNQFRLPFGDEELFGDVSLQDLLKTFSRLMTTITPNKVFNVYESVTVNEKIALMQELFETQDYITLEQLIVHADQLLHIICSFMAILDACKLRMITLVQSEPFGPILIRKVDEAFEQDFEHMYDDDFEEIEEEIITAPISEGEEERFFEEDADNLRTTTDDGRVFLYDDESEDEQIILDDE